LNLWKSFTVPETRVFPAAEWRFGDDSLHRFWQIYPCDGRRDRQTDGRTDRIAMAKMHWSCSCFRAQWM